MMVVTNVVWTGKSLLKGTIEKGSIEGQRNGSHTVVAELKEIISNAGSTKKKTRKRTKTIKQASETKREISTTTNVPADIADNSSPSLISSLIDNFDLTSISGIVVALFTVIFLISLVIRWFRSGSGPSVVLVRPGRILIDGNEYNYVPNIKTLYEVYEDDIMNSKGNHYKGSDFVGNVVTNSESSIWDWLENRGDAVDRFNQLSYTTNDKNIDTEYQIKQKNIPDAKKLQESIKITEQQLKEMKHLLEKAENLN